MPLFECHGVDVERKSCQPLPMPKRSSKKDINTLAHSIVLQATGELPFVQPPVPSKKNPAAVALGRLGGIKGGAARAAKLSPEAKKNIALKGAQARWGIKSENAKSE